MKVVILCGGKGTRIRDVAQDIPKPMIEIGGKPIAFHIMEHYAKWDFKKFVLCLGYKGHVIKDFFLNYQARISDVTVNLGKNASTTFHTNLEQYNDWEVTLASTGIETLTGTRITRAKQYIQDDSHFMLTYGDGLSDIDINALVEFHKSHGKLMTVTGVRPPARFGEIEIDDNNCAIEFSEKPQASAGIISGGFFVCNKEVLDFLDKFSKQNIMLERDPMKELAKQGELMVYEHDGFWHPMDTYRDYSLLRELWLSGNAPWAQK